MDGWARGCYRFLLLAYPSEFRYEYGGVMRRDFEERYQEQRGAGRIWFWLETLADLITTAAVERYHMTISDLKQSVRRLRAHPGVAVTAITSLALGIGANTTVFSELYASLLRPLPYKDADRMVMIYTTRLNNPSRGRTASTPADFIDWQLASKTLEDWQLFRSIGALTATVNGSPERITCQHVTPRLFADLGVRPVIGRLFEPGEEAQRPALISESYWQRRFGGRMDVIGQKITAAQSVHTIVGVVPASFEIFNTPGGIDFWNTIDLAPGSTSIQRSVPWLDAVARLKPGVSPERAQAELSSIAAELSKTHPKTNRYRGVVLVPFGAARYGNFANVMYPVCGAVGLVLLIACSNVANLLLARATSRRREIALRAALGAGRVRLVRELLVDGIVLAVPGVLVGLALADVGIMAFRILAPDGFPGADRVELNPPVLLFTITAGLVAAVLSAIFPALQGSRTALTESLKEAARGSAGRVQQRTRSALVSVQIALAMILLVGAGLLIQTIYRVRNQPLGFDARNVTVAQVHLSGQNYLKKKQNTDLYSIEPTTIRFYEHLLAQAKMLPGVESVALAGNVPMGPNLGVSFRIGLAGRDVDDRTRSMWTPVTPGYFETLRIPLRRGRWIGERDVATSSWVAVVNEAFVREFFPNADAIGQTVAVVGAPEEGPREIVGIVADHTQTTPQAPVGPEIYTSYFQHPREIAGYHVHRISQPKFLLRASVPPPPGAISKLVADFDPNLLVFDVRILEQYIAQGGAGLRFYTHSLALFAAIALILASIGIYGLMSYSITERVQEIGIRMALGASRTRVIWLITAYGLRLALVGLTIGMAGALAASRVLSVSTDIVATRSTVFGLGRSFQSELLFGITPTDPVTFSVAGSLLLLVAMSACLVPALRATRIDPASALRRE